MPRTRLARSRLAAFNAQQGLCYYCVKPMWLEDPAGFRTRWNLTSGNSRDRRCTAEHLVARKDGGGDGAKNIAAACLKCNRGRHARKVPMEPEEFGKYVRANVRKGRWHHSHVLMAFESCGSHIPRILEISASTTAVHLVSRSSTEVQNQG